MLAKNRAPGKEASESREGVLLRPADRFPKADLKEVAGYLRSKRKPRTLAQMRTAVGREVIRRYDRGRY